MVLVAFLSRPPISKHVCCNLFSPDFFFHYSYCHNSCRTTRGSRHSAKHVGSPMALVVITEDTGPTYAQVYVGESWGAKRFASRESAEEKRAGPFHGATLVFKRHGATAPRKHIEARDGFVGGNADACTSKEQICFNAKVLSTSISRLPSTSCRFSFCAAQVRSEDVKKNAGGSWEKKENKRKKSRWPGTTRNTLPRNFYAGFSGRAFAGRPIRGLRKRAQTQQRRAAATPLQPLVRPDRIVVTAPGKTLPHEKVLD